MSQPLFRAFWFVLGVMLCSLVAAQPSALNLQEGWQYRWGDSPFNAQGQPLWALEPDAGDWHDIGFPSNPPDRRGRSNVWYRVTLPEGNWHDPVLYIYSVDLIVEVYLGGERIYHYGTFDANGQGQFEGWPWHAIDLPPGFSGEPLYFRIFSDYTDIGLWGEVQIVDRQGLYMNILSHSIEPLVVAAFNGLVALLAVAFALVQSERRSFASVALFSFSIGVMLVAESQASLLIVHAPLLWDYLAAGAYFTVPVAIALLLAQWLSDTRPKVIGWIWKLHLAYLVGALGMALSGLVGLSSTFPPFDALFAVTTVILFVSVLRRWRTVNAEQRLIIACYAVLAGLLMLDMAVAHSFLPWSRIPVSHGALVFSLAIVVISLLHYRRTQQAVRLLNHSLERKVGERTRKLEQLAQRERVRAHQLLVENNRGRYLNDLVAELQDCHSLKEGMTLWAGRLAELCQPMSGRAYGRLEQDAGLMLMADWGYPPANRVLPEETLGQIPPPSRLAAKALNGETDAGDVAPGYPWCLQLSLPAQPQGRFVAAVILLEPPQGEDAGEAAFHPLPLFLSLEQSLEKTAITLSSLALREELERLSYEDALTGLKNRRFFEELLRHEMASARRSDLPLSLLIIDIDFFKRFNDDYGHPAGDAALRTVAEVLRNEVRDSDVVCRLGGEEFVVLMPGAAGHPALDRAELLRRAVSDLQREDDRELEGLTISVGVATWPDTVADIDQLFLVADQALYQAKQNGRNCVSAA